MFRGGWAVGWSCVGFRVQGRVENSGFRIKGSEFKAQGTRFRVQVFFSYKRLEASPMWRQHEHSSNAFSTPMAVGRFEWVGIFLFLVY